MKHIVYNPDGNVDIKLKVELIESDQNPLTDEQKEFAEAFLNGANLCYYAMLSSEYSVGICLIMDNGYYGSDSIQIEYLESYLSLPSLVEKEAQITFNITDQKTYEPIQIIEPIPVKITPIKNGIEVEDTQAIPVLKTIVEDEKEDQSMLVSLKEMKSKKIEKLPQGKTDTFTILDGDKRIENVYFNIYAIKGEPQQMYAFSIIEQTVSEDEEEDVKILGLMLSGLDEYNSRMNYIDNIPKCMNFCGNINVESTPKTFTYVQLRLFDSNGNDLSLNEKEYKIDFSNAEEEEGAKMISLRISAINN